MTWALGAVLGGVLWACGSDGGGGTLQGSLSDLGIVDGAEKGLREGKLVDGSKDEKIALRNGAALQIPKGAVRDPLTMGIERPSDNKAIKLVEKLADPDRIASAPYILTPHGAKFDRSVTVTLPIGKMGDRNLQVAYLEDENDKDWEVIDAPLSKTDRFASVELDHFSVVILIEAGGSREAGADPGPDASGDIDASDGIDAGGLDAEVRADAGTNGPDATPPAEAGADIDAGTMDGGEVDAGSKVTLLSRLYECGVVETTVGYFVDRHVPYGPYEACRRECLLTVGTCSDIMQYRCLDQIDTNSALGDCVAGCSTLFTCTDTGQAVPACDGITDCANGSDEQGCDPEVSFTCGSGTKIPAALRCDGEQDCPNGEDEASCLVHICQNGSSISHTKMCNTDNDCDYSQLDVSDEPADCIYDICPIPQ